MRATGFSMFLHLVVGAPVESAAYFKAACAFGGPNPHKWAEKTKGAPLGAL